MEALLDEYLADDAPDEADIGRFTMNDYRPHVDGQARCQVSWRLNTLPTTSTLWNRVTGSVPRASTALSSTGARLAVLVGSGRWQ